MTDIVAVRPGSPTPPQRPTASVCVSGRLGRWDRTLRLAFASAVVSLVAAFAAVDSTIPGFNIYRAEDGFTNVGISMTVLGYSVATIGTHCWYWDGCPTMWVGGRPRSPAAACSCRAAW